MSYQIYSDVREWKLPFPSCRDSTCMWILASCKMLVQWITTMLDKDYISGRDTITMPAPRHEVWRSACGELVILHVPVSSYRLGVYKHIRDDNEPRSFARRLITFGVTSHQGLLYYDIVLLIRSEYCHVLLLSHTWILTPDEKQHSFEKCAVTTDRKKHSCAQPWLKIWQNLTTMHEHTERLSLLNSLTSLVQWLFWNC